MRTYGIYIGRFQPFHKGHAFVIDRMMEEKGENSLIIIGSCEQYRTKYNPLTFFERICLIKEYIRKYKNYKPRIIGIPDFNNKTLWNEYLIYLLQMLKINDDITFYIGSKDDDHYQNDVRLIERNRFTKHSGTNIRDLIRNKSTYLDLIPDTCQDYMKLLENNFRG